MVAYSRTQRPQQLRELAQRTKPHFHQEGRWNEQNIAQFARGCRDAGASREQAVGYFNEAIDLHRRNNFGRVSGDEQLSYLYRDLARAVRRWATTRAKSTAVETGPQPYDGAEARAITTLLEIQRDWTLVRTFTPRVKALWGSMGAAATTLWVYKAPGRKPPRPEPAAQAAG